MEFSGKTAFVTGAANGIGLGVCRALARNGVNIVLADIERAQLEIARRELATFNVRTRAIEVDVSDAAAFERAADEAEAEFGNKMAPSALPCSARILTGFDSIARYSARERPT